MDRGLPELPVEANLEALLDAVIIHQSKTTGTGALSDR